MSERAVPLLGDVSLELVQRIEHQLDAGFVATRVAGLAGEVQQRTGRPSHTVVIEGSLAGETAKDQLQVLQQAAAGGEELTFAADITTALELQKVVITGFRAVESAGRPGRFDYAIELAESPPLPPPAEVSGFGGLDDFGLGELGIDPGVLGDIADAAGEIAGAVETALAVVDALGALANLDGLSLGDGLLQPLSNAVDGAGEIAGRFRQASGDLARLFGGA